jgi:hypothetical protein
MNRMNRVTEELCEGVAATHDTREPCVEVP